MLLNDEIIIYKESYKLVNKNDLKEIKKDIIKKKSGNFLILEEEIYITEVETIKDKEVESYIEKEIKKEFNTSDYLFHYIICKKEKKSIIYAIKGGDKISPLLKFIKKIKVVPIQFKILKLMEQKLKKKTFKLIVEIENKFYYLDVVNGILRDNYILLNKENFNDELIGVIEGSFSYPFSKKELFINKGAGSE